MLELDGSSNLAVAVEDVNSTSWRNLCRARWVRQEDSHGCGVACLAMLTGSTYESVRTAFIQLGLDVTRGRKRAFASNFHELMAAAHLMGLHGSMKRWQGWDGVKGFGVIKVPTRRPDWHWMTVEHTRAFGVVVQDPALDWPAFERAPLDVLYRSPGSIRPCGNWISFS